MANFLARISKTPGSRSPGKLKDNEISPISGLVGGSVECGSLNIQWVRAPSAPCELLEGQGSVTLFLGYALDDAGRRIGARDWVVSSKYTSPRDGFFVVIHFDGESGLQVVTDLLGAFPIYYAETDDAFWVGSSPALLERPIGERRLNLQGMVSLLLFSFCVGGHVLLRGVTRLSPGKSLSWTRAYGFVEHGSLAPLLSEKYFDELFSVHVERMYEQLCRDVTAHVEAVSRPRMLLTGGRDSRVLAGIMSMLDMQPQCLTFGRPDDVDVHLAREIGGYLGWEHVHAEIDTRTMLDYARKVIHWEQGAIGLGSMIVWGELPLLALDSTEIIVGHMASSVIGGMHIRDAFKDQEPRPGFDNVIRKANMWGLDPATVTRLVRDPYASDLVEQAIHERRSCFEMDVVQNGAQRAWLFDLLHRQRSMLGGCLWRYSFVAWPVVPMLSHGILNLCGGLPPSSLADRRAEDELLLTKFPGLSGIPIDQILRTLLEGKLSGILQRRVPMFGGEQRMCRLNNLDDVSWLPVRCAAERGRGLAHEVFDEAILSTLLPEPDVHIGGSIHTSWSRKALLEVMLWLASET